MSVRPEPALVDAMFAAHGITGPWEVLPATGLANDIFATRDVVLRVATDHRDGISDARTESVAAPVARAAGIRTPRLLAFDDTRAVVDRPFSLWERIHGETLGLAGLSASAAARAWREVGRELARLHSRVQECPDPNGYLDETARADTSGRSLERLLEAGTLDIGTARQVGAWAEGLRTSAAEPVGHCFVHNDVSPMNVMCTPAGELLAIIDWGDAGWGDPNLDFVAMPPAALPAALEGHEEEAPGLLGPSPEARVTGYRLSDTLGDLLEPERKPGALEALRRLLESGTSRRTGPQER
jgi:aminoglycoside phosphotransferase (APT) family kinase protein